MIDLRPYANSIVLALLLLNTLISLGIFVVGFFAQQKLRPMFFTYGVLCVLAPVVLPLFLALSRLAERSHRGERVDMQDVSFSKIREKLPVRPDLKAEMNYVSVRDAMYLSNLADFRRLLIDILKYRTRDSIHSIAQAMNSEDTEASHYAASAIQDVLSEYRITAQRMLEQLKQYPDDVEINLATLEYIYVGLKFRVMTDTEQRAYVYTEDYVAQTLYSRNTWFMTAQHYSWMIELMLSIQDYRSADKWLERALACRPGELDTYKSCLRLLYAEERRAEFFACLDEIKHSELEADRELLDIIRLYQ